MRYSNTLIAVKDMDKSLQFYKTLFEQEVACDLGWCKTLTCGLTLQLHFDQIAGFDEKTMVYHNHTMELYFETEDFDAFLALLQKHPAVEKLHEAKTYPWGQRGIHIYDPDGHLIEIGESTESIARRYFAQGKTAAEAAQLTQFPEAVVTQWYQAYKDEHQ